MSRNDWYNLGNDIRDIVQNAVDTQDFDKLNQAINGAITGAIKTAEEGLKDAGIIHSGHGDGAAADSVFLHQNRLRTGAAGLNRRTETGSPGPDDHHIKGFHAHIPPPQVEYLLRINIVRGRCGNKPAPPGFPVFSTGNASCFNPV